MTTRNKIYIIFSVFILIVIILMIFLVYPFYKAIKQNYQNVLLQKTEAVSIKERAKELDQFKNDYQEYETAFKKIDAIFVNKKNPIDFIKFLEQLASQDNILLSVNILPNINTEGSLGIDSLSFTINTKGDFVDILSFLEKLEKSAYLVNIEHINVSVYEEDSKQKTETKNLINGVDATFEINVLTQ